MSLFLCPHLVSYNTDDSTVSTKTDSFSTMDRDAKPLMRNTCTYSTSEGRLKTYEVRQDIGPS